MSNISSKEQTDGPASSKTLDFNVHFSIRKFTRSPT